MTDTKPALASENCHYYDRESGAPRYEVPYKSKDGMRPTTLADARKLNLVPSVTLILGCIDKPGLNNWKAQKLLEASMTLPMQPGEVIDDYAKRVMEDAKAEGIAAADRGTQLHAAIEHYISNGRYVEAQWQEHLTKLDHTLQQHGINIHSGKPEHSFSAGINGLYFGGKTDFHTRIEPVLCDFKSKDRIEDKKQLAYDEHAMQIAAYGYGLFSVISSGERPWKWQPFRGLNVFVGVNDCEVRVIEHAPVDLEHAFSMFQDILSYWSKKNRFGKYST